MIADLNVHWDIGEDGMPKPHAHVMLTMRSVDENGFGQKVRDWNRTEMVERWRERWAEHVNERLAELDIDARIDTAALRRKGSGLSRKARSARPRSASRAKGSRPQTAPTCTARSPGTTARGSSPIHRWRWTRSRISNRPSRGATWRSLRTGTATASTSSTRSWARCAMHPIWSN